MDIVRNVTNEQKQAVQNVPDFLDDYEDDYETYRSTQQATDPTHIEVNVNTTSEPQPQLFNMKMDAQEIAKSHEEFKAEQEHKALKKNNEHIANMPTDEQNAIVCLIVKEHPEVVFDAVMKFHELVDESAFKADKKRNGNSWESHKEKYEELLRDLVDDLNVIKEHLNSFHSLIGF